MSTALELTRAGWKPYLEAVRRLPPPPPLTSAEEREREQLLDRIRQAAMVVKRRFGAQRVVLFGSLAHHAWFGPDSDVDLGVEGLTGDTYWEAWRTVEEILGDRSVDLIEMETAGGSLRQAIARHGVEL